MGRIATLDSWIRSNNIGFALNLGSKATEWGNVRVDIDENARPHVVATCLRLPFRPSCFDSVLFTDVLEHTETGHEEEVLDEIARVLRPMGLLLLTTPNDRLWYRFLDPAWWLFNHRHYRRCNLLHLLRSAGFKPIAVCTVGEPIRETLALLMLTSSPVLTRIFSRLSKLFGSGAADLYRDDEFGYFHFVISQRSGVDEESSRKRVATRTTSERAHRNR
jgi:SAM-dependent methyltransferase